MRVIGIANADNLHAGHRSRMWDRYLEHGITDFKEHELLEVLLYILIPRVNTNEIAHKLINEFGSLKNVLLTHIDKLMKIDGIGKTSAMYLKFIGDIFNYISDTKEIPTKRLTSSKLLTEFCIEHFKNKPNEVLSLILMDDMYALLNVYDITSDDPNRILVDYREIFIEVLRSDCRKVVLAHNHITGTADPSDNDIMTTREIGKLLSIFKVDLVDHIIVRNDTAVSMRSYGILNDLWD